jgi:hypothetical protein
MNGTEVKCPGSAVGSTGGGEDYSLELVTWDGETALLYVYRDGNHLRTARGRAETLREFAREHYAGARLHETP